MYEVYIYIDMPFHKKNNYIDFMSIICIGFVMQNEKRTTHIVWELRRKQQLVS